MKRLSDIEGVIDRRLLVNFRVDPDVARRVVPDPFRVDTSKGFAIAGICLIRLTELRPRGFPRAVGITSESAAHRFAVKWETDRERGHGVYIPRRDTDSRLSVLLGGRAFPGEHHHARFDVHVDGDGAGAGAYDVVMDGSDATRVAVTARRTGALGPRSVFADGREASEFFRRDTLGYSLTREPGRYDGVELQADQWQVDPLEVEQVSSSFFDDTDIFPAGSVEFDCALAMHRTTAHWRSRRQLRAESAGVSRVPRALRR